MRLLTTVISCLLLAACSGVTTRDEREAIPVLFVGNSLTYVGNLPAVFDAVSRENNRSTASDMLVTGGATLTDRVKDGSVARALESKKYSYVVLQERGGDFACGFGPEVCANARQSLLTLTELVRKHGATPILLGTYQTYPPASREIVQRELLAAENAGIGYVSVSDRLLSLRNTYPEMTWFASDGAHPGADLTLLDALLLFEHLHEAEPQSSGLSVQAPIYTLESWLTPDVRAATAPSDLPDVPTSIQYASSDVARLLNKP